MEWKLKPQVPADIAEKLGYSSELNQLLFNRGIFDRATAKKFFHPDYSKLHDPFLFKDMNVAVARILLAIENKESIVIHGDYDADGVTAAAVLYKVLTILGGRVEVFIPSREQEGYGLNMNTAADFVAKKYSLLITVDCGISNFEEINFLEQNGVDVIVTDHHEPPAKSPRALAIINPKFDKNYPFRDLAGVGVAYKLAQAILRQAVETFHETSLQQYGGVAGLEKWLLDLVAIGTVADCMPLLDENRVLAKYGVLVLKQTQWLGLQKLLKLIGADIESISVATIGFQIGPRLNAAGRMNHANQAFKLLVTEDGEEADKIGCELHKLNSQRQQLTERILKEAKSQVGEIGDRNIYFVYSEKWEIGVCGLVAGKLAESFSKPAVVATMVNGNVVGSVRGTPKGQAGSVNVVETFRLFENYFCRLGGHSGACGFTLKADATIEKLADELHEHLAKVAPTSAEPILEIDAAAELLNLKQNLLGMLDYFEPFGEGNRAPVFLVKNLEIVGTKVVGKDGKYLQMFVCEPNHSFIYRLICFSNVEQLSKLRIGDIVDAVVEAGLNVWNGASEIQYKVVDIKSEARSSKF
ncbi:MAG: single-stranded-DNA-specific exonuclease RecJ [Candidatus Falkowbacteria bacterium]